jgi:hypothetical protein
MARLLHPKHEAFAQAVAAGVGLSDAYEQVGFVRRRGNPNRLARRPKGLMGSAIAPIAAGSAANWTLGRAG